MPRYRAPTIAEQGGLETYLTKLGIDYHYFKELKRKGEKNAVIARLLSDPRRRKIGPRAVKHWKAVDDAERAAKTKLQRGVRHV